ISARLSLPSSRFGPGAPILFAAISDCGQSAIYIDGTFSQPYPVANRLTWSAGIATCMGQMKGGPASNENTRDRPSFLRRKVASGRGEGLDLLVGGSITGGGCGLNGERG